MKKKLLQYGICGIIGALMAYWVMDLEGLFLIWGKMPDTWSILCDAFFVPGILLTMLGLLFWVANTGFFDAIAYAFRTAAHIFLPFIRSDRKTFYDYKAEKAEKRASTPYFVFLVGAFYLLLSGICLVVWCTV